MLFTKHLIEVSKKVFVLKKVINCILIAIVPALLFYSFSLFGLKSRGFEIMEILRDPAQQSGASSFLGFLSNIGIWLWVSSASICFFTIMTSGSKLKKNHKELIFLTGVLSIILAMDDFFLIHDRYINQKLCYLFYAFLAIAILIRHSKKILEIEGFAFLVAGTFLALSILTDLIQSHIPLQYSYTQIFEEGFKFMGVATWLYFNSRMASFR
ncbi:MAG: hypothetical protein V7670_06135 [Maribacter arcticus]|uniref:hypothetical protein n=1 Tax=Maribacter arcticus TaxID=561365 RepID=UPI00300326E7